MIKDIQKVSKKSNIGKEEKNHGKVKIPITFNSEQIKIIENFEGILGNTKAEIIRNIVINWILTHKKEEKNG